MNGISFSTAKIVATIYDDSVCSLPTKVYSVSVPFLAYCLRNLILNPLCKHYHESWKQQSDNYCGLLLGEKLRSQAQKLDRYFL
jgi:hypothetical protein